MVAPKGKVDSARSALDAIAQTADLLKGRKIKAPDLTPHDPLSDVATGLEMRGRERTLAKMPEGFFPTSVVGRRDAVSIGSKEMRPVPKAETSSDPARASYDNAWKHMKLNLDGGNVIQPKDIARIFETAEKAHISNTDLQKHATVFMGLQMARLKYCASKGDEGGLELTNTNMRTVAMSFNIEIHNEGPAMVALRENAAAQADENAYIDMQAERFSRGLKSLQDMAHLTPFEVLSLYTEAKSHVTYTADPRQSLKELDDAYAAAFKVAKPGGVALLAAKTVEISKYSGSLGGLVRQFDDARALLAYSDNPKQDLQRLLKATDRAVQNAINYDVALIRHYTDNCGRSFVEYDGSGSRDYADAWYRFEGISDKTKGRLTEMGDWLYSMRY